MERTTILDDLGTALDPPKPEPSARVRYRLDAAIAGNRNRPRLRLPHVPLGVRLAGAVALAAVLAIGGLAVRPTGTPDRPATAAADVLLAAADTASHATGARPRADQYVFLETVWRFSGSAGPALRSQTWISVDGSRPGLTRSQSGGVGTDWVDGRISGNPVGYYPDLPTDPARLLEYLKTHPLTNPAAAALGISPTIFDSAAGLLTQTYLTPEVQATLLRALSRIPGITVVPDAVDGAGRHGVGVREPGPSTQDSELVFATDTHAFLGAVFHVVPPVKTAPKDYRTALVRIALVDRAGQLP